MGAIGPKKKRSIHKRNVRHGSRERTVLNKLSNMVSLTTCQNCNAKRLTHRACLSCGYYRGKQVLTIKSKSSDVIDA